MVLRLFVNLTSGEWLKTPVSDELIHRIFIFVLYSTLSLHLIEWNLEQRSKSYKLIQSRPEFLVVGEMSSWRKDSKLEIMSPSFSPTYFILLSKDKLQIPKTYILVV